MLIFCSVSLAPASYGRGKKLHPSIFFDHIPPICSLLQFIGHIKHTCISPDEITSCGPTFRPPSDPSLHLQYRQYWCPSSYSSAVSWPHNMTFFQTKIKQMFQHLRNTAKVLFPVLHLCTSTGLAEGSFRIVML